MYRRKQQIFISRINFSADLINQSTDKIICHMLPNEAQQCHTKQTYRKYLLLCA